MASASQSHPSFPSRPYSSALHGKLPERSGAPGGFGATSNRETARLERERAERERGQNQGPGQGGGNTMNGITDEQREEISEAVSMDCRFCDRENTF